MSGKVKYKVGDEFPNGKRLVEYIGSHPKFRTSLWKWECVACGKIGGPSLTNSITRPKRPACCYQSPSGENAARWLGHNEITGSFLYSCRYNAAKRGFEFSVTPEQLWQKWLDQNGRCVYSDRKLTHGVDASLDRINSSLGYIPGNVQWVHRDINRMKSDFDEAYFIELCQAVAKKAGGL